MMEKQFNFNDYDVRDALVEYVKNHFDADVSPEHSTVNIVTTSGTGIASRTSYKATIKATDLRKKTLKKADKKSEKKSNDDGEKLVRLDDDGPLYPSEDDLAYEEACNTPY